VSKPDHATQKNGHNKSIRWVVAIFIATIFISGAISFISEEIMQHSSIFVAFAILLIIVLIGILFDIIGVAVTSADEKPFHSMAARKVPGSLESIRLLRSAEKVSSICNDVVGDICGVVSGAASATIAVQIVSKADLQWPDAVALVMSALVAGLTVGGKAIGKTFAINSCTGIVFSVGKILYFFGHFHEVFNRN